MRSANKLTLSKRAVDALPIAEREAVFWDRDLTGFGVRVHPTGSKATPRAYGRARLPSTLLSPSVGVICATTQLA